MEHHPKVEIFLTVYDRHEFLEDAIKSVISQSFQDFLLTILDDGGRPEIAVIIKKYIMPRIRHHVNPETIGVAASLFSAIERSRAEFFAILNDDDFWRPDFLKELVTPLEQYPTLPMSFCDHWLVDSTAGLLTNETDENTHRYGRAHLTAGVVMNLAALVVEKNAIPMAMGAVGRRSAVPSRFLLNAAGRHYDYWLSLVISNQFDKAWYVPTRLSCYRVHPSMETMSLSARRFDSIIYIYMYALVLGIHKKYRLLMAKRLFTYLCRAAMARAKITC